MTQPNEDINKFINKVNRVTREDQLDFGEEPKTNRIVRCNITGCISQIVRITEEGGIYLQRLDYFTGEPEEQPPYNWDMSRSAGIQYGKGSFTVFKAENFNDYQAENEVK